jgi:hypothetical protein
MKSSCANESQPIPARKCSGINRAVQSAVESYSDSPASRLMRLVIGKSVLYDIARAPGDSIDRSSN